MAAVMLIPIWLLSPTQYRDASWGPMVSVIWLGIGPTGIATIVLFIVIERAGSTFLSIINYLIPVVAFCVPGYCQSRWGGNITWHW